MSMPIIRCIGALLISSLMLACGGGSSNNDKPVKIFKSDGSVQCEEEHIELAVMRQELVTAGVDVICSQSGHTGNAYDSVCGGETGNIHIFSIHRANIVDAKKLGFEPVATLANYEDKICRS